MNDSSKATRAASTKVLLIADDIDDQELIGDALAAARGQSFELLAVPTLADGTENLGKNSIDVVLLDLILPDSQGLTTFLKIQPRTGHTPVVVLANEDDEDIALMATEKGAVDYLIKDQIDTNLLVRTLRYATERTHTVLALKASEAKYRELYENVIAGVFQTTPDGRFLAGNPALVRMLGYESEEEILELDIGRDVFMYPEDRKNWVNNIEGEGEIRNAELTLKRKDGSKIVVLENSRSIRDDKGRTLYYEGTLTDITEAHELSKQLSYEASHDALTGLVNRREFELRLQNALERSQVDKSVHALCYLDLDQFKIINDTCGHIAGDELLRQLAEMLQSKVRTGDQLARLGGDEFGVLLLNCPLEHASRVATVLLRAIDDFQFVWGRNSFSVGVSIGLVPVSSDFKRITEVMSAADAACYAAKDQGRNRIHIYQADDTILAKRHGEMQWVSRVKRALEEERFTLYCQPIVPVAKRSKGASYYEVLLRMFDTKGRTVPPGAFMPAVERYNLVTRMDDWVIKTALNWMASHQDLMKKISMCFINLSGDSVSDTEFVDRVNKQFDVSGVPPDKICFEITETAAIANFSSTNRIIRALKGMGCQFALDDFGSGMSSFAYLKNLPVDFVKIDGIFVRDITNDPIDFEMVRSINDIGHVMGKQTIAEHVEHPDILEKLKEIQIDFAQGFAVGRPRPIEEIAGKSQAKPARRSTNQ